MGLSVNQLGIHCTAYNLHHLTNKLRTWHVNPPCALSFNSFAEKTDFTVFLVVTHCTVVFDRKPINLSQKKTFSIFDFIKKNTT